MGLLKELNQEGMTMAVVAHETDIAAGCGRTRLRDLVERLLMFDRDASVWVAHNVLAHPLRTTLTGLSVALGIFILVVRCWVTVCSTAWKPVRRRCCEQHLNTGRTQMPYRGNKSNRPVHLENRDLPD